MGSNQRFSFLIFCQNVLWLTLPMLRLFSSIAQGCKYFGKSSKPCHVGIHWKVLAEYSQMSTHLPGFQPFFRIFASFCISQSSHQQNKGQGSTTKIIQTYLGATGMNVSITFLKIYIQTTTGHGFDRHLLGLRCLAESSGSCPEIFRDEAYARLNHIILSTSTMGINKATDFFAFGPVTPEGYGIRK